MVTLPEDAENFYLQDNQKMMPEADAPLFFTIDEKHNKRSRFQNNIIVVNNNVFIWETDADTLL